MHLMDLSYPVYRLRSDKPITENGIVCYIQEKYTEDIEGGIITTGKLQVVDDTSLHGTTLATRRLQMKAMGVPMYPLRKAFFFLGDLIKVAKPDLWFIDSKGKIFTYQKTRRSRLVCQKITSTFSIPTGGAIIEVEHSQRFKVLHNPDPKLKHAGVLFDGKAQILYGLYEEPFDETWRMI